MLSSRPDCPGCGSNHIVKNSRIYNKKPKYKCQSCSRQFVRNPNNKIIDKHTLDYIDKMLLEKISLARIARVTSVSKKWLQNYVNTKYASVPQQVKVLSKHKSKLNIKCDEAWSFLNHQGNKQWIWLALDKKTREIVGCYIGKFRGGLEDYGIISHQFIGNVLFVIQIIGRPLSKLFQANGIKPWVKTVG